MTSTTQTQTESTVNPTLKWDLPVHTIKTYTGIFNSGGVNDELCYGGFTAYEIL